MKDSAEHGGRLKKLCSRLKVEIGEVKLRERTDPTTELVLGCLSAVATEAKAHTMLHRIRNHFVDFNELRVSRPEELAEVMGKQFPKVRETAGQIGTVLKQVFVKHDSLDLSELVEGNKRDAKAFLDGLGGVTPYLVARVMLNSLEAHAFPVHEGMLVMLKGEDVIPEKADAADVQGFLERHVSATSVRETHALLRKHADNYRPKRKAGDKAAAKATKKKTAKKAVKKSTKKATKKTAKKTTQKTADK